jgi:hypothetical protein
VNARDLSARLGDAPVPDEGGSRERSWRVVSAAYAERGRPLRRGRAERWVAVAVAAVCAATVVVAFTPPGEAVGEWLRRVVHADAPKPAPTLQPLTRHGRLLVVAANGPWIVGRGGESRRLGAYDDATFSEGCSRRSPAAAGWPPSTRAGSCAGA